MEVSPSRPHSSDSTRTAVRGLGDPSNLHLRRLAGLSSQDSICQVNASPSSAVLVARSTGTKEHHPAHISIPSTNQEQTKSYHNTHVSQALLMERSMTPRLGDFSAAFQALNLNAVSELDNVFPPVGRGSLLLTTPKTASGREGVLDSGDFDLHFCTDDEASTDESLAGDASHTVSVSTPGTTPPSSTELRCGRVARPYDSIKLGSDLENLSTLSRQPQAGFRKRKTRQIHTHSLVHTGPSIEFSQPNKQCIEQNYHSEPFTTEHEAETDHSLPSTMSRSAVQDNSSTATIFEHLVAAYGSDVESDTGTHHISPKNLPKNQFNLGPSIAVSSPSQAGLFPSLDHYSRSMYHSSGTLFNSLPSSSRATSKSNTILNTHAQSNLLGLELKLKKLLDADKRLGDERKLHVYVDMSNINIGFHDLLKTRRGLSINSYMRQAPFSFAAFARILERGRKTARKIVGGSKGYKQSKLPQYFEDAKALDYKVHLVTRVPKEVEENPPTGYLASSPRRGRRSGLSMNVTDYVDWTTTSGDESTDVGSNKPTSLKYREQCVDEGIHIQMLQDLVDHDDPRIAVLATGDANIAEFSDGFYAQAKRMLKRGWRVELWAWKQSISSLWLDDTFQRQWQGQFEVFYLDGFINELHDGTN